MLICNIIEVSTFAKMEKKNYIEEVHEVTKLIPKGRVTSYGAIADYLSLGSARMVGWALNKVSILDGGAIPAHRVLNRKGELSGRNNFPTPETMSARLEAEGIEINDWKVVNFKEVYWYPEELEA